ncbi:MAG: NfeD family protein [Solirubrobacteraceae bacterium]
MTVLGLVLLVVGALVAVAEAHYPSHGVAGGAGVLAMAVGAVLAVSGLGAGVLAGVLAGVALAGAGFGALTVTVKKGVAVRQRRIRSGAEALVGQIGEVRSWAGSGGRVSLAGALWRARRSACDDEEEALSELHPGDQVVVERLSGLTLSVRPAEKWELF